MRIAVDFDGTIVENRYPAIGTERPHAVETLKRLASEGDDLILWTSRTEQLLKDALEWCDSRGLRFTAVNSNHHVCISHQNGFSGSRKIQADIFIDDKNIGGFPGWTSVYAKIRKMKRQRKKARSKGRKNVFIKAYDRLSLKLRSQLHPYADLTSGICTVTGKYSKINP